VRPRLVRRARLRWDARAQRYLLLSPERGFVLNRTAGAILELCAGALTADAIAAAVRGPLAEVQAFLEELARRDLVEWLP
jgi:coenzyme PQQ biosynthesis protein PqqD